MKKLVLFLAVLFSLAVANAGTQVKPDLAIKMLEEHNRQFDEQIVKIADRVYVAVGYDGANTSMIVGDDGVVIIDALAGEMSATKAFKALRKHSDKPVKAIIYTHSHPDHIGGARVFAGDDDPVIFALDKFGKSLGLQKPIGPIMRPRTARQFGNNLKPDERTNRGITSAKKFNKERGTGFLKPTHRIGDDAYSVAIAGIEVEMYSGPGETDDALFIWLPQDKILFSGDNFYQTFPNLYAIRGTPYRNVLNWADSVATMAALKPHYLIGGHTLPIQGQDESGQALRDYGNAIRSVYDQTVKGINEGKGPDLIAHQVELPENLRDKSYLVEFYGSIPHAVRSIYAGLLGWFDGNPVGLNPQSPRVKAQRMAALAGGEANLTKKMLSALRSKEFQWALELAEHVKWLENRDGKLALKTKIAALRGLAAKEYNAPNRNYYLSYANELESGKLNEVWY